MCEITKTLTPEQRTIVEAPIDQNIIVIACPGSGKTTTLVARVIYLIQQGISPDQICAMTFSKVLGDELRRKLPQQLQHIGTIDSYCYRHLSASERTNQSTLALRFNQKFRNAFDSRPLWILFDEGQDLDAIHRETLEIMTKGDHCHLFIVGDPRQCIYQTFRGADPQYMFQIKPGSQQYYLSVNFRSTQQILKMINQCFGGPYPSIQCGLHTQGPRPQLHLLHARGHLSKINRKDVAETYLNLIQRLLRTYQPHQIAILAPSVRNATYVLLNTIRTRLANTCELLVNLHEFGGEKTTVNHHGMIYAGSIHSAKGLEWEVVILANFYQGLGAYHPEETQPSVLFVGCTRAKQELYLMETTHAPLKCAPIPQILSHRGTLQEVTHHVRSRVLKHVDLGQPKFHFGVTDLLTYLSPQDSLHLEKLIKLPERVVSGSLHGSFPIRFRYLDHTLYGEFLERVITRHLVLHKNSSPKTEGNSSYRHQYHRVFVTSRNLEELATGRLSDQLTNMLNLTGFQLEQTEQVILNRAYLKNGRVDEQVTQLARDLGLICDPVVDQFQDLLQTLRQDLRQINDPAIPTEQVIGCIWNVYISECLDRLNLGVYQIKRLTPAELNPLIPQRPGNDSPEELWKSYLNQIERSMTQVGLCVKNYQKSVVVTRPPYIIEGIYDLRTTEGALIDIKTYQSEENLIGLSNCLQIKSYTDLSSVEHATSNPDHGYLLSALTGNIYRVGFGPQSIVPDLFRLAQQQSQELFELPKVNEDEPQVGLGQCLL